jgi:hypothetical protein
MRDIRDDLKERLQDIERQRSEIQKRLIDLKEMEERLSALLEAENLRYEAERQTDLPLFEPEPMAENSNGKWDSVIARFVIESLDEHKGCDLQMLKRLAAKRGIPFGHKSPGRVLHFLLVGMQDNGVVTKEDDVWRLIK